jgi:hypothetical protein
MMIRVRAWNSASKEMFSPETMAEDQLTLLPTGQFINVNSASTRLSVIYPIGTMIPMLSTGTTDQHGTEIFADDIVRYDYHSAGGIKEGCIAVIKWDSRAAAFNVPLGIFHTNVEVIGNVHQNPELIPPQ